MDEIPWAWYLSRASALVAYFLLWLSIFFGLSIRTPLVAGIIKPIYSLKFHRLISVQALVFALIHGLSLLFDKFLGFGLANVLIPFFPSSYNIIDGNILALGIIGLYLMIILVLTSVYQKHIPYSVWRGLHSLNAGLFIIIIIHAAYLGSDLKEGIPRFIFIFANIFLGMIFAINILTRLKNSIVRRNQIHP